jgi:hypothetical protein
MQRNEVRLCRVDWAGVVWGSGFVGWRVEKRLRLHVPVVVVVMLASRVVRCVHCEEDVAWLVCQVGRGWFVGWVNGLYQRVGFTGVLFPTMKEPNTHTHSDYTIQFCPP